MLLRASLLCSADVLLFAGFQASRLFHGPSSFSANVVEPGEPGLSEFRPRNRANDSMNRASAYFSLRFSRYVGTGFLCVDSLVHLDRFDHSRQ